MGSLDLGHTLGLLAGDPGGLGILLRLALGLFRRYLRSLGVAFGLLARGFGLLLLLRLLLLAARLFLLLQLLRARLLDRGVLFLDWSSACCSLALSGRTITAAGTVLVAGSVPLFGPTTTTGGCGGFRIAAADAGDRTGDGVTCGAAAAGAGVAGAVAPVAAALERAGVNAGGSGSTCLFAGIGGMNGSGVRGSVDVTPDDDRRENLRRDHHDQLGLVLLRRLALEQQAEDRDVADARNLLQRRVHRVVHQAGDRERLAVSSSTSVSVRRVLTARESGSPAARRALAKSSVLTSGRTFRWTRSP